MCGAAGTYRSTLNHVPYTMLDVRKMLKVTDTYEGNATATVYFSLFPVCLFRELIDFFMFYMDRHRIIDCSIIKRDVSLWSTFETISGCPVR